MNKNKTNLSVVNNIGVRVKPSIIVGEQGSYSSGDILDANAVEKVVKNKVNDVIGDAADALDTLEELGGALPTKLSLLLNDVPYLTQHLDISGKANTADLATVAISGSYNDLTDRPTIPAAQILSDWNLTNTNSKDYIKNKPTNVSSFNNDVPYLTEDDLKVEEIDANGHEYVDLGLPSGTLWATMDVGASNPEDYGNYFAWGETEPKDVYSLDTYDPLGDGTRAYDNLGNNISGTEYDAARANWGGLWVMPTYDEIIELVNNTTSVWTTLNGVNGRTFTSKTNGNAIFIPAAGTYGANSKLSYAGEYGFFWSSTITPSSATWAQAMRFFSGNADTIGNYKYYGLPIRPVLKPHLVDKYATKQELNAETQRAQTVEATKANTADLATVATTGSYNDLTNKPANVSAFNNDAQYLTEADLKVYPDANGHDYVDLGLPSGTNWATMNVGATSETDYGLYFQWGDTQGYTADQVGSGEGKKAFSWSNYKRTEDDGETFIKYNTTDGKTVLDLEDDAVRANWGGSWRMPTGAELQELIDNTNSEWTTVNNVKGCKFTSKTDNSKYIFIPAAGYAEEERLGGIGDEGNVFSSSLYNNDVYETYFLYFGGDNVSILGIESYFGFSVRGVLDTGIVDKYATKLELNTTTNNLLEQIEATKNCVNVTYSELVSLRDNSELVPGQFYRITDYVTTVNQYKEPDARSAGHPFDIIVFAEANDTLSETAHAILHDGDTYFNNSNIAAWEIRYRLDNVQWSLLKGTYVIDEDNGYTFLVAGDITLAGHTYKLLQGLESYIDDWSDYALMEMVAEDEQIICYYGTPEEFDPELPDVVGTASSIDTVTEDGKGIIIWMKDEFGNECPYDFKNVLFKRWLCADGRDDRMGFYGLYMTASPHDLPSDLTVNDEEDFIWAFTFSDNSGGGEQRDYSLGGHDVHDNIFKPKNDGRLANNVMYGNHNYLNSFGINCHDNSFNDNCEHNSWGNNCYSNSCSQGCSKNSLGTGCNGNSLGNSCYNNSFGNNWSRNSCGDNCISNSCGHDCHSNSFGSNWSRNSWGNDCCRNSCGHDCHSNSWGDSCQYNSWGNLVICSTMFDGVQHTQITTENVKYAQVLNGVASTSSNKLKLNFAADKNYTQVACLNSSGQLKIYVPGDLVQ